jgi:hypothetical protein
MYCLVDRITALLFLLIVLLDTTEARRLRPHHHRDRNLGKGHVAQEASETKTAGHKGHKKKGKANFMNMLFDRRLLTYVPI